MITRERIAKTARFIAWGIFLVTCFSAGIAGLGESAPLFDLVPAVLIITGIPVIAVAEFHIQRYEIFSSGGTTLFLVLLAVPTSYAYMAAIIAHASDGSGLFELGIWLCVFIVPTALLRRTRVDLILALGAVAFVAFGSLLVTLSTFLVPRIYYGWFKPNDHLPWSALLSVSVGVFVWSLLGWLTKRLRAAAQQADPADAGLVASLLDRRG